MELSSQYYGGKIKELEDDNKHLRTTIDRLKKDVEYKQREMDISAKLYTKEMEEFRNA